MTVYTIDQHAATHVPDQLIDHDEAAGAELISLGWFQFDLLFHCFSFIWFQVALNEAHQTVTCLSWLLSDWLGPRVHSFIFMQKHSSK